MNEKIEQKVNFFTNLTFFVVLVLFVGLRICSYFGLFDFMGKYASYYLSIVVQIGLIFLVPLFLMKKLSKSRTKDVFAFACYKKTTYKIIIASVLLGVIVFFLNVYVSNFFNNLIGLVGYKHSNYNSSIPATWWTLILDLVLTAVLPAICEETLNRGILLNGNSMLGVKKSVLISGLLFGLLHMNIEQFFYATLIGFLLGYICWWCGSIYPCMIVHFMNNALSVFLSFASKKGWGVGKIFERIGEFVSQNSILGFLIFVLFLILLCYMAYCLVQFMLAETVKTRFERRKRMFAKFAMREAFFSDIEKIQKTDNDASDFAQPVPLNEEEFLKFVDNNVDEIVKSAAKSFEENKFKMTKSSKIFLIATFVLSGAMTLFTFIWGLL